MPQLFAYKARNLAGRLVTGRVEAETTGAAVALLREKNLFVVSIKPVRTIGLDWRELFAVKIGVRDLAVFCRQFATMVGAGIPLLKCLDILAKQAQNRQLERVLREVITDVEKGKGLSDAFNQHRRQLPEILINMLVAGEVSGRLEQTLLRLAVHFEKEHEIREKVKSAMTYPLFVAGIAVAAVIALLILIVPVFVDIFNEMGAELPLPTRMVIGASTLLTQYWYLWLLLLAALFLGLRYALATKKGKACLDRLLLRMPVVGPLVSKTVVARFARTFAALLQSGVPMLQSLETVERIAGNTVAAAELAAARAGVKEGERMAGALLKSKVFPPMAVNMIAVGEEAGTLDDLLEKLSDFYERETAEMVERLSSIVEPLLIALVGILVGFIAISIYLPMFGLSGAIQGGAM